MGTDKEGIMGTDKEQEEHVFIPCCAFLKDGSQCTSRVRTDSHPRECENVANHKRQPREIAQPEKQD